YPGEFAYLGDATGRTVLFATTPEYGRELWVTDGTDAGTALVKDIRPGTSWSPQDSLFSPVLNGRTYFAANSSDVQSDVALWSTDGTASGTYQVKDFNAAPAPSPSINEFTQFNGKTYFAVDSSFDPGGLWVTDGTAAGTQRVAPHSFGSIAEPVPYNGALYYLVFSSFGSTELWKTDGTPAGTALVRKISNNNQPRSSAATV